MLFPSVIGLSNLGHKNTLPTSPTFEMMISPPYNVDFERKLYECSSTNNPNVPDFKSVLRMKYA